ncbi:MAG: IS5 family transposase [Bacteroidota bacterium]
MAQKDVDARWAKKNNQTFYGYKDHVKSDTKSKLITHYMVTSASVHDSQAFDDLLQEKDRHQPCYADSAYVGPDIEQRLKDYQMENEICGKGIRHHPLTGAQRQSNRKKSKTRYRAEHIFGFIENSMKGYRIRSIGMRRSNATIRLMNLTYNLFMTVQLYKIQGISTLSWS